MALIFETHHASVPKIGCVQIAGLVARRILCDVDVGDKLAAGQVYGLIRFGSRVDIWLPASIDAQYCLAAYIGRRDYLSQIASYRAKENCKKLETRKNSKNGQLAKSRKKVAKAAKKA